MFRQCIINFSRYWHFVLLVILLTTLQNCYICENIEPRKSLKELFESWKTLEFGVFLAVGGPEKLVLECV